MAASNDAMDQLVHHTQIMMSFHVKAKAARSVLRDYSKAATDMLEWAATCDHDFTLSEQEYALRTAADNLGWSFDDERVKPYLDRLEARKQDAHAQSAALN